LVPANYPFLDVPPPIDSPEVQQWIQEVKDTGIEIPGFSPTNPGAFLDLFIVVVVKI
jgi:hypothetical protein